MSRVLEVTRQGYEKHKESLAKPHRHAALLAEIQSIIEEDEFNDRYGRERIHDALLLRGYDISLSTVYRVCRENGICQKRNKPKGLTKAEKGTYKNDDLLQGNFDAEAPNEKLISDITQLPTKDGILYISAVFDCFDNSCIGLAMDDNMKTPLVIASLKNAVLTNNITTAIFHTDRGCQYTSHDFRVFSKEMNITQSMSFAGSSCYGNAKCESMFGRFKEEAIYGRYKTEMICMEEVKTLVFRYFMGYWNNRRICHSIAGVPPILKRRRFFQSSKLVA